MRTRIGSIVGVFVLVASVACAQVAPGVPSQLEIPTSGSPGNFTRTNTAQIFRDATGAETGAVWLTDWDGDNNFNSWNIYVGYQAALSATTNNTDSGFENVGIGTRAFQDLTTGSLNTGLGSQVLENITTGAENVGLGQTTLFGLIGGSKNTGVGRGALFAVSSGDSNIGLGYAAGANVTTGDGNISIGLSVDAQSATADNQLSIANLIFSSGPFGTGTTPGTGDIGIGKVPTAGMKLDIAGLLRGSLHVADPCDSGTPANTEGAVFYNSTADILCLCNGAGADVKVSDGLACF